MLYMSEDREFRKRIKLKKIYILMRTVGTDARADQRHMFFFGLTSIVKYILCVYPVTPPR